MTGGDYTGLGNSPAASNEACTDSGADCGGAIYARASVLTPLHSVIYDNIGSCDDGEGSGVYI